jgi:hypothetical protein
VIEVALLTVNGIAVALPNLAAVAAVKVGAEPIDPLIRRFVFNFPDFRGQAPFTETGVSHPLVRCTIRVNHTATYFTYAAATMGRKR